jgi:hypothetical protein
MDIGKQKRVIIIEKERVEPAPARTEPGRSEPSIPAERPA